MTRRQKIDVFRRHGGRRRPQGFAPRGESHPDQPRAPEAAGTHVSTYLAVANRDDAVRPNPFDIDFHRRDNPHASFGLGVHRCLGAHLARLEIVYEEWHKRIPAGTTPRVKWPRGTLGLDSLHLTFGGET
jgi:hypothetical protein